MELESYSSEKYNFYLFLRKWATKTLTLFVTSILSNFLWFNIALIIKLPEEDQHEQILRNEPTHNQFRVAAIRFKQKLSVNNKNQQKLNLQLKSRARRGFSKFPIYLQSEFALCISSTRGTFCILAPVLLTGSTHTSQRALQY